MTIARQPEGLGQTSVPQLHFRVRDAAAEHHCAVPTVNFALVIRRDGGGPVRSVLLDVQLQIAARQRVYGEAEQSALAELFGAPQRWGQTLRTLPWTRATIVVPPFEDETEVSLPVACSYDLQASAPNYLSGLRGGAVPLEFLFAGSVFFAGAGGMLQTARIAWDREAQYSLPVRVWRQAMDRHFPGAAWLCLQRETFDRLRAYRAANLCGTFEEAVERLLEREGR